MSTEDTTVKTDVAELPERLDLRSEDVAGERREELLRLFPEVATENGEVDFDQLKRSLGEQVDSGKERYSMSWPGKAECFRAIQTPSMGTLLPLPEESVHFDKTENLIIEGDNLEVLKLLQKAYLGKVKVIYIDPPYNTGNDFIYPDNYAESLQTYLEYTGQVDAEGKKFSTNTDTGGRFHSKWLNMMYPRLYLARNLLREDGVILISIDDAEIENLRRVCDEIFGESNLVACLVWEKGRKNDAKFFSVGHEYMVVYARSLDSLREAGAAWREEKPGAREIWDEYIRLRDQHGRDDRAVEKDLQSWYQGLPQSHPSRKWARYRRVDPNGPWRDRDISWPGGGGATYDVIHPVTGKPCKVPEAGWRYASSVVMQQKIGAGLVEFRADHTEPPFRKAHLRPVREELEEDGEAEDSNGEADELATQVRGTYFYKQSQVEVKYLRALMGAKVFDNPKDHEEIARLIDYVVGGESSAVVLDFFAGSGSTGEAVLKLNARKGTTHSFVLVQLPEPCRPSDRTGKAALAMGLETIAEITKERIRRVITRLDAGDEGALPFDGTPSQDRGFRAFKLGESNFTAWDASAAKDAGELEEQLALHVSHVKDERSDEDLLSEILLKSGFPLTTEVVRIEVAGKQAFLVADGALLLCLDRALTLELIREIAAKAPERVVCLDEGFAGNDQLKTNAVQIFKAKGITSFKTV